jgi:O-6-methylguanine DNA methyltransferase
LIRYRLLKTSWGILAYLTRNDKLIKLILPPQLPDLPNFEGTEGERMGDRREAVEAFCLIQSIKAREAHELLPRLADDLRAYFSGRPVTFGVEYDLSGLSDFSRSVLDATARISYGQTASYGEIARQIGKPKSFRAVARSLSVNPIPIVIPCHRVIYSSGQPGGYSGSIGPAFKERLLEMEKEANSDPR